MNGLHMTIKIKEHSWLALIAARRLKTPKVAMVIGRTIHLHNTSRQQFLRNQQWVCHELAHVQQWQHFGHLRFLVLYLLETFRKGYYNNRFELAARNQENNTALLKNITFV